MQNLQYIIQSRNKRSKWYCTKTFFRFLYLWKSSEHHTNSYRTTAYGSSGEEMLGTYSSSCYTQKYHKENAASIFGGCEVYVGKWGTGMKQCSSLTMPILKRTLQAAVSVGALRPSRNRNGAFWLI